MKITVKLNNGFLPDKYSKFSDTKISDQPVVSFPIHLENIPDNTKYLAITLIDYDAVTRTGAPFIHWLISDIPVQTNIPEDFSRIFTGPQGKNTWYSRFYTLNDNYVINHYAGPVPPDKPHAYTLTVYALNQSTDLENGFFYNQFRDSLKSKILDQQEIKLLAKN